MVRKKQALDKKELDLVYDSIEDLILKNKQLCSITEISYETGFDKYKCRKLIKELINSGKIKLAYGDEKKRHIYIPKYMYDEIFRIQYKAPWLKKYAFEEKITLQKQIEVLKNKIHLYEMPEKLLYDTHYSLEGAVAYALTYLGFKNVKHHPKEDEDVSFEYDDKKYVLEIEGTASRGSKKKVTQLSGWTQKEVDKGIEPDKLVGIFVVNHFRNIDPENRKEPLTKHAINFLKLYRFKFFTTYFLFKLIKKVTTNSLTKKEAQECVIMGEKYD